VTTPARRAERVLIWAGAGFCVAAAFSVATSVGASVGQDCTADCNIPVITYILLGLGLFSIIISSQAMINRRSNRPAILHSVFSDEIDAVAAMRAEASELDRLDEARLGDSWATMEEQHLSEKHGEE
jgi:hypothetical protein